MVIADQSLDVPQKRRFFGIAQRDRHACGACSPGSPDAMHIGFRHVRQIEIHHVADTVNIDATGGDVGSNERPHGPFAEGRQDPFALVLRFIAVNGFGRDAAFDETADDLVRSVLRAGKHQSALNRLALQYLHQRRGLGPAIDTDHPLLDEVNRGGDRGHGDLRRVAQHLVGEIGDGARHRRRKEQGLPRGRKFCDDFADVVDEAHVEHPIGFIEHQKFHGAETERVTGHEVEQASRRRNEHIDAALQRADLGAHRDATDHERGTDAHMSAVRAKTIADLPRQLAGRTEHQHAAGFPLKRPSTGEEMMQDRQRERRRLAGACLCNSNHVTAREGNRNGLRLNWRGRGVFFFGERTDDRFGEAEVMKRAQ